VFFDLQVLVVVVVVDGAGYSTRQPLPAPPPLWLALTS